MSAFTDVFIKRPVMATVVNLLLLLIGVLAIAKLNVREYPNIQNAVVVVTTAYPGASADLVRGFITTPIERSIASADGIDYIQSESKQGFSIITVRLRLNYPPNDALTQITSKVDKVKNDLPPQAQVPVLEINSGTGFAAIYLAFSSDTMDGNQITDYLTRVVQPKLSTLEGVQSADILGARTFAMRVWIKPQKLAAYGISPGQLQNTLAEQNYLAAVGNTKGAWVVNTLSANTDLKTVDEFKDLVIKRDGLRLVRLRDVADVVLGAEDYDGSVKMGTSNATFMGVYALPNANVIDVVKRVRAAFPEIQSQLPRGLDARIPYDSTIYINDSINEVIKTLAEAIAIVVVVIYLFLGSVRSALIPIVAIPLSLIGGCFLMMLFGFSINLLTLLAMVLAIGLVVDDSIVVVENITRHIEEGLTPFQAAIKGGGELVGPVISITITLMAVFAPVGLQGGLTGLLFKEFAFTLAGAVFISGVVSLTLTHMMCAKILKPNTDPKGLAKRLDAIFEKLKQGYKKSLDAALNMRVRLYIIAAILLLSIFPMYILSQKELSPTEDAGFMLAIGQAQPNASVEQTEMYANRMLAAMEKYPETKQVFSIIGLQGRNASFIGWVLKPSAERKRTTMELQPFMQKELHEIPGLSGGAFIPPSLPGAGSGLPVQFVVCSTAEPERVAQVADELLARAIKSGKFYFGDTDLKFDQPQTDIIIDRDKAARLGVNMQTLASDMGTMLGGNYVNRFAIEGRSYKVIPQVTRVWRLTPDQLDSYYVSGPQNGSQNDAGAGNKTLVPLSAVASLKQSVQPRSLTRFQQLNAATISLLPANGVSLGDAYDYLSAQAKEIFPQGFSQDTNGELRQYVQEGNSLVVTFILAILIVYLVLAAQYESFLDPFVIIMSVPLAIVGAMVFIFLGAATINIYTQVGMIALVGIIAKNGILIVEFANNLRAKGMEARQAVEEAAAVRLRPILMTTFAAVFGVVPLLLAQGPGAVSRFSIGLVIATGLSIGTIFTLYIIPALYMLVAPLKDRLRAASKDNTAEKFEIYESEKKNTDH